MQIHVEPVHISIMVTQRKDIYLICAPSPFFLKRAGDEDYVKEGGFPEECLLVNEKVYQLQIAKRDYYTQKELCDEKHRRETKCDTWGSGEVDS